jgi:hypothetical protein
MDVCLKIPDAPEYRRAFVGHLYQLGLWASWEKSYLPGDTRAKEAGQLWRDVLNQYLDMGCEMGCCCPEPNGTRFNADGSSSVTYDGGETWVPNPDDPRTTAPQLPPPTTTPGDDTKCKAANNALQQIKNAQAEFAASLGTGLGLLQLALAIAGVVALVFFTARGGLFSANFARAGGRNFESERSGLQCNVHHTGMGFCPVYAVLQCRRRR